MNRIIILFSQKDLRALHHFINVTLKNQNDDEIDSFKIISFTRLLLPKIQDLKLNVRLIDDYLKEDFDILTRKTLLKWTKQWVLRNLKGKNVNFRDLFIFDDIPFWWVIEFVFISHSDHLLTKIFYLILTLEQLLNQENPDEVIIFNQSYRAEVIKLYCAKSKIPCKHLKRKIK